MVNWSTWLSALVSCKDRVPAEFRSSLPDDVDDEEPVQFNLLKATGDLLMLPKDILLDSEIRKEVIIVLVKCVKIIICHLFSPNILLCKLVQDAQSDAQFGSLN